MASSYATSLFGSLEPVRERQVFSRFDKYARRYLAFVHFASTVIWLK